MVKFASICIPKAGTSVSILVVLACFQQLPYTHGAPPPLYTAYSWLSQLIEILLGTWLLNNSTCLHTRHRVCQTEIQHLLANIILNWNSVLQIHTYLYLQSLKKLQITYFLT